MKAELPFNRKRLPAEPAEPGSWRGSNPRLRVEGKEKVNGEWTGSYTALFYSA